jgi:hypothetical protein
MALTSPYQGLDLLGGVGNIANSIAQTHNNPSIRTPQQAISQLPRPGNSARPAGRMAGATQQYDPATYAKGLSGNSQDYLSRIGGFQSSAGSTSPSRVDARSTDPSVPGLDTFRSVDQLENVRNAQQNSLAGTMDWMQQQNWNRDKQAYTLQKATEDWSKNQDQNRSTQMMSAQFNQANQGQNLQQGQIDSDASYARQRQMTQDARDWDASHKQTAGTARTAVIGGGGGGSSGYSASMNLDPYELLRIQSQYALGMAQVGAQNYASTLSRDASNYGNFMNASISRH